MADTNENKVIRKLEAISECTTLIVEFTEVFGQAISTVDSPSDQSILTNEVLKFFTKKFTLVVYSGTRLVATNYETLFELITSINAAKSIGLIGSLAVVDYNDPLDENLCSNCDNSRHRKARSITLKGIEHIVQRDNSRPSATSLVSLRNEYNAKEVKKSVFKFSHVELRDELLGFFVGPPPALSKNYQSSEKLFINKTSA